MRASTKLGIAGVAGLMAAFTPVAAADGNTVHLCHHTGSDTNPIVLIDVSENAVDAHLDQGDTLAFFSKAVGRYVCAG